MGRKGDGFRRLFEGAVVIFIGIAAGRFLGLFGQVLVIRSLPGKEAFGRIALAFAIVSVVGSIAVIGVPDGVARFLSVKQTDRERLAILRAGYALAVGGAGLAVGLLYVGRVPIARLMDAPFLVGFLPLFSLYVVTFAVLSVTIGALRGLERTTDTILTRDVTAKVVAIVLFLVVAFSWRTTTGAIIYFVSIPTVGAVLALYFLSRRLTLDHLVGVPRRESLKELVSFSLPLAAQRSITEVMLGVDVLMVGFFLQPGEVGLYRAAQPLTVALLFILLSVVYIYLPIATTYYENGEYDSLGELFKISTKWIAVTTFPLFCLFVGFGQDILRIFYTTEYIAATPALQWLSVGMYLRTVVGPDGATIKAINKTKVDLVSSLGGLGTNLMLNIALVPRFGITGAAIATGAGFLVFNAVELGIIYRTAGIHPFSLNLVKPLVPTAIVAVALAGFWRDAIDLPGLVAVGLVLIVVQMCAVVATRSFEPADMEVIDSIEQHTGANLTRLKMLLG